jgi:hypothetical protein
MSPGSAIMNQRQMALLKEAYYLTDQLAEMDKRIQAELDKQNGKLAEWIDAHPAVKWAENKPVDTARDTALRAIFDGIFRLIGLTARIGDAPLAVISGVFEAGNLDQTGARRDYYFARFRPGRLTTSGNLPTGSLMRSLTCQSFRSAASGRRAVALADFSIRSHGGESRDGWGIEGRRDDGVGADFRCNEGRESAAKRMTDDRESSAVFRASRWRASRHLGEEIERTAEVARRRIFLASAVSQSPLV